jgi:hypothetical protein
LVGDLDVLDNKLINIKELNDIRLTPSKRSGKQVQQLTIDGELVKVWNTMGEIEKTVWVI